MRSFFSKRSVAFAILALLGWVGAAQAADGTDAPAPKKHYKSVEDREQSSNDYFKGSPYPEAQNVFVGFGLDFFDSFGIQGRYSKRVIDRGFIPDLNNSFSIEGGLGLTFYGDRKNVSGITGFSLIVAGRWDFQMDQYWTFFADLGLGFTAVTGVNEGDVRGGSFFPAIGVGAMYSFNSEWAARADLSYQFFGVGIVHRF